MPLNSRFKITYICFVEESDAVVEDFETHLVRKAKEVLQDLGSKEKLKLN